MVERQTGEPKLPTRYDHLLAWKNYVLKLGDDLKNGVQREDTIEIGGPLSDEDAGRVDGLMRNFWDSVGQEDEVHLLRTLSAMQKLIKERGKVNAASVGVEGRVKNLSVFESTVMESPLSGKLERKGREVLLSTFRAGVGENIKKAIEKVIFAPGKNSKEIDSKFFDDGFVLNGAGITIYNPSMGIDGEFIPWRNSRSLSFSVDAPAILDFINAPRRVLLGKPKVLAPVAVLTIFERAVSTDTESPSKVRVLLERPREWEDLLNNLREKLGYDLNKTDLKRPISWNHFVSLGLMNVNGMPLTRVMDRMLSRIYAEYLADVAMYNQEIQRRDVR